MLNLIAGPCVFESYSHTKFMAVKLKEITDELSIPFVFKVSWDKANRTKLGSYRGVDIAIACKLFYDLKKEFEIKILTDFHLPEQAYQLKDYIDMIQVPAFLCRQTDMLVAAAKTNLPVVLKKGQFMDPYDMLIVAEKVLHSGNKKIFITERGTTFGYRNLIVDMRNITIINQYYSVIFDATHSIQRGCAGGSFEVNKSADKKFIEPLASAAVAVGVEYIYLEVHDNPSEALCDGSSMLSLSQLKPLLEKLIEINKVVS